jgi:hypothetical protein
MAANKVVCGMHDYCDVVWCDMIYNDYAGLGRPAAGNPTYQIYPQCAAGNSNAAGSFAVHADPAAGPEISGAAFQLTFGMSIWMALIIHAIGVEIYFHLTPAENERLKAVSYKRQLEAEFNNPGRAGLTVDRFGDVPTWQPPKYQGSMEELAENSKAGPVSNI